MKETKNIKTLVIIQDTDTGEFKQLILTKDQSKLVKLFLISMTEGKFMVGDALNLEEII